MTVAAEHQAWFEAGEAHVLDLVDRLGDDDLAGPSRLPEWSRAHVVGHLARNADAIRNLLRWARTGEPSPMYRSVEERADGIDAAAAQDPAVLRDDLRAASARLLADAAAVPADAWEAEILTARGEPIPASTVPWMRAREAWVHAVDLDAGASFVDAPPGFVAVLLEEMATRPGAASADPALRIRADDLDRSWTLGTRDAVEVHGAAAALVTWLSGRSDGGDLGTSDPSGRPPRPPRWI